MTEQIPPEIAHDVEEKPAWSSAPRSVDQTTFPVGDCPVTVAVHLVCEPAVRGLACEPAGEQTTVMLVDWAVASRGTNRSPDPNTRNPARSNRGRLENLPLCVLVLLVGSTNPCLTDKGA